MVTASDGYWRHVVEGALSPFGHAQLLLMDLGRYLAPFDDFSLFALVCFGQAAMNLIPLPLLNGGNAILYFVSSVLWPVTPRAQERAFRVSVFVILLGSGSWLCALIYLSCTSWGKALFAFLVCGVLT